MASEILLACSKPKKQGLLLELDFQKVFDNINWSFLLDLL